MRIALKLALFVIMLVGASFFVYISIAKGLTEADIVFPIKELGNCGDKNECKLFCDKPENLKACLDIAEKYNLISAEEIRRGKKFAEIGEGPGGCTSQSSCEAYCNDIGHIDECLDYAERHGILPLDELEEARKVQAALRRGAQLPGGCRNKDECDAYCENSEHTEECIAFGVEAGFIPPEEAEEARMALEAIKKGVKPPPCRGKMECDVYCSKPEYFEECISFAEAAGFVSPKEAEMARKTGGKGPGDCKGKEECEKFCEDENNFQVCVDFAVEYGLMSSEDAEMVRKTGGKGPGDCKGKEECEKFCENPANQEACFNFAKEHDLISEDDLRQMEEGKSMMLEALDTAPPEVIECLESAFGAGLAEKLQIGAVLPSREMGDKMRECFEEVFKGEGAPGGPPSEFPGGPPEEFPGAPKEFPPTETPMPPKKGQELPREGWGQPCPMDARTCPDGSYVGRIPPKCEFAPCPGLGKTIVPEILAPKPEEFKEFTPPEIAPPEYPSQPSE